MAKFLGEPPWIQELDSVILRDPFQLGTFYGFDSSIQDTVERCGPPECSELTSYSVVIFLSIII